MLRCPSGYPEFANTWPIGIDTLDRICCSAASTDDLHHFILQGKNQSTLRFSAPMFELKVRSLSMLFTSSLTHSP